MRQFTTTDLIPYLLAAVGDDDDITLTSRADDIPLNDLGIDSLAVIDATSHIERDLGITLPDGSTAEIETMGDFCSVVNAQLVAAA